MNISLRVNDAQLASWVDDRSERHGSTSAYMRYLIRCDLDSSLGLSTPAQRASHWARTGAFQRLIENMRVVDSRGDLVRASMMRHQVEMVRAMDIHDRLMIVACRRAGVTTMLALYAIAQALRGNSVLCVVINEGAKRVYAETLERTARSLQISTASVDGSLIRVDGGGDIYTVPAPRDPNALRSKHVDCLLVDNTEFALSEDTCDAAQQVSEHRVFTATSCTSDWMNDLRDTCVTLRYPWTQVANVHQDQVDAVGDAASAEYDAIVEDSRSEE